MASQRTGRAASSPTRARPAAAARVADQPVGPAEPAEFDEPLGRGPGSGAGALGWATFVFALIGLGLSIYLTYEHFTGSKTFACPASSHINCEKVTTSAWSHLAGIPVAVLGLAFFVGMVVLLSPYAWRFRQLDWLRVLGVVVGILTALYLVWAEAFRIKAICLYCTGVHVVSLILLGLVLWTTSEVRARVH